MKSIYIQSVKYHILSFLEIEKELPKLLPKFDGKSKYFITSHWTAGSYRSVYNHYQINITDKEVYISDDILEFINHQHTWQRNNNNIGIALCAMATIKGKYLLPTDKQIEVLALIQAILKHQYHIPYESIVDHAYWAKLDGYTSLRWDIRLKLDGNSNTDKTLYDKVLEKTKWYYEKLFNEHKKEI